MPRQHRSSEKTVRNCFFFLKLSRTIARIPFNPAGCSGDRTAWFGLPNSCGLTPVRLSFRMCHAFPWHLFMSGISSCGCPRMFWRKRPGAGSGWQARAARTEQTSGALIPPTARPPRAVLEVLIASGAGSRRAVQVTWSCTRADASSRQRDKSVRPHAIPVTQPALRSRRGFRGVFARAAPCRCRVQREEVQSVPSILTGIRRHPKRSHVKQTAVRHPRTDEY